MQKLIYNYVEMLDYFDDMESHHRVESYLNQDELTPKEAAFLRGYYQEED